MSRTIKFRVFDKVAKKMHKVTGIRFTGADNEAHKISLKPLN